VKTSPPLLPPLLLPPLPPPLPPPLTFVSQVEELRKTHGGSIWKSGNDALGKVTNAPFSARHVLSLFCPVCCGSFCLRLNFALAFHNFTSQFLVVMPPRSHPVIIRLSTTKHPTSKVTAPRQHPLFHNRIPVLFNAHTAAGLEEMIADQALDKVKDEIKDEVLQATIGPMLEEL
jgi:hypothetical protein